MATRAKAEEKGKLRRRTKWGSKSRSKKERKLQRRILRGSSFEERELSFFQRNLLVNSFNCLLCKLYVSSLLFLSPSAIGNY
jgi:hypothetical protein